MKLLSNDEAEKGGLSYKFLLAEDNLYNLNLISMALEFYNHSVIGVENGALAVEKARSEQFDAILMDIDMPVMDGIEATNIIRSFNKDIPIIAVTSLDIKPYESMDIEEGFDGFLSKTLDFNFLENSISKIIEKKKNDKQNSGLINNKKIAVVDSEPAIRNTICELLSDFGMSSCSFETGSELIEQYKNSYYKNDPFKVLFIDLELNGSLDGVETFKKIVEFDNDVTAIAMSSYPEFDQKKDEIISLGFRDKISKPFDAYTLKHITEKNLKF
ncbi:MAG: response regulator [Candidatus Wallbacteria bacterium]